MRKGCLLRRVYMEDSFPSSWGGILQRRERKDNQCQRETWLMALRCFKSLKNVPQQQLSLLPSSNHLQSGADISVTCSAAGFICVSLSVGVKVGGLCFTKRTRQEKEPFTGRRRWHPLQRSCLENPRDGGAWRAAVHGVAQSRTRLKQLSSSSSTGLLAQDDWQ